jgi:sugar O-acyltransferase (sialic acid O-acetyltransferase NeuD family)
MRNIILPVTVGASCRRFNSSCLERGCLDKHIGKKVVILGAGGFAREVLDVFDACNAAEQSYDVLGYIVDSEYFLPDAFINDKPVLGDFNWLAQHIEEVYAICGVGSPDVRYRLTQQAQAVGARFCNVVHPSAIMTRWIEWGEGVVITAGCIFTNQIRIGNHVHVNLDCTIGHDVFLEDFVTLSPGVHVSGKAILGTGCYIGTGANIIDRIRVGEWSIVGAGSTIVKDVPPNTTVVGVPGQVVKARKAGWHLAQKLEE